MRPYQRSKRPDAERELEDERKARQRALEKLNRFKGWAIGLLETSGKDEKTLISSFERHLQEQEQEWPNGLYRDDDAYSL